MRYSGRVQRQHKICDLYVQGMANITFGALIVGVAGTINTVMVDGMIIDTIINALANAIVALPSSVKIIGMFLVQTIINLPINSGTGQAAATMPIAWRLWAIWWYNPPKLWRWPSSWVTA